MTVISTSCFSTVKGRHGDAANVLLSAVQRHNLRRVLKWLRDLLRLILQAILPIFSRRSVDKIAS